MNLQNYFGNDESSGTTIGKYFNDFVFSTRWQMIYHIFNFSVMKWPAKLTTVLVGLMILLVSWHWLSISFASYKFLLPTFCLSELPIDFSTQLHQNVESTNRRQTMEWRLNQTRISGYFGCACPQRPNASCGRLERTSCGHDCQVNCPYSDGSLLGAAGA